MTMADEIFSTLPASLRRRIDKAFDTAINDFNKGEDAELATRKETQINDTAESSNKAAPASGFLPAGFIPDNNQGGFLLEGLEGQPGGFIADNDDVQDVPSLGFNTSPPTHIAMSCIPAALKLLDLPPDDDETLSVFRNAASGWTHSASVPCPDVPNEELLVVSRDDWRAVCAVLLESPSGDRSEGDFGLVDGDSESDGESDEYQYEDEPFAEESSGGDDSSDGEYITGRRKNTKSLRNVHARSSSPRSGHATRKLAPRQSLECRHAFALFFPGVAVDTEELDRKRISIKEISKAATLLKEKIKAEEIIEMLEAFSTSADKSMDLGDFEKMMIAAKLV